MRRQIRLMIDAFRVKRWPWVASMLAVFLLAASSLAIVGLNGNPDDTAQQAKVEKQLTPTVPAEKSASGEEEKEFKQDKDNLNIDEDKKDKEQVNNGTTVLPAPQKDERQAPRPKIERNTVKSPDPVVKPPKPIGIQGQRDGLLVGRDVPAGQYIIFGNKIEVWNNGGPLIYKENTINGRSSLISLSDGQIIIFYGKAYTPEQVAILDKYYNGIGW